jgi:glycine/D-amino acid oxidase-like deaminating enzyme
MSALTNRPQRVVIVGGGIHGASIAYHLSLGAAPPDITIVERSQGSSASYKSGGFLAREWGSGPTVQLHQKSFDLHEKLAKELSLTSFRRIPVVSVSQRKGGKAAASWLDGHASTTELEGAAAQVTPAELTHRLIEEATKNGAKLVHATAVGCEHNEQGKVEGVVLSTGETLEADKMVVALGPWSGVVCEDWFDAPIPMQGIKSTSLLYTGIPEIKAEPFACFCDEDRFNCHLELYPRPDGSLYICGCGGSDYVSGDRLREGGDCFDPASVKENVMRVEAATSALGYISETFKTKYPTPSSAQACMRPCTSDGLPTMSEIPGFEGAYVSAGHNCWGILWAPICGKAVAALMTSHDGTQSVVDLSAFHIERFLDASKRQQKQKQNRGKTVGEIPIGEQW